MSIRNDITNPNPLPRETGSDEFMRDAGGGTRTHTVSPPTDFESASSTNSNTPAQDSSYTMDSHLSRAERQKPHPKRGEKTPSRLWLLGGAEGSMLMDDDRWCRHCLRTLDRRRRLLHSRRNSRRRRSPAFSVESDCGVSRRISDKALQSIGY